MMHWLVKALFKNDDNIYDNDNCLLTVDRLLQVMGNTLHKASEQLLEHSPV